MIKRILHADADAFFASIEVLKNPSLSGKPVIVGSVASRRGVVSTASYEARKYGIKSGQAMSIAKRLCPNGIFLDGDWKLYSTFSTKLFNIFEKFAPYVNMASIDEAYLDISETITLFGGEENLSKLIKNTVENETGLTISVGIGSTYEIAKIASSQDKPDGLTIVLQNCEKEFLKDLSVSEIPGVGNKSKKLLEDFGISRIGDLFKYSKVELISLFGKFGLFLWEVINSVYSENKENISKSFSRETTFDEDITDFSLIDKMILKLSTDIGYKIRKENLFAKNISIKLRYSDFRTITRSETLFEAIYDDIDIYKTALKLVKRELNNPVRLIGVGVSNFTIQNSLSLKDENKNKKFLDAIDKIRDIYGFNKIKRTKEL
jgi:DNA polymerase IV